MSEDPPRKPSGSHQFVQAAHAPRTTPGNGTKRPATLDDVLHAVQRLHGRFDAFVEDQTRTNERLERRLAGLMDIMKDVLSRTPPPMKKPPEADPSSTGMTSPDKKGE